MNSVLVPVGSAATSTARLKASSKPAIIAGFYTLSIFENQGLFRPNLFLSSGKLQQTYKSCIALIDVVSDRIVSHFFALYRQIKIFRKLNFAAQESTRFWREDLFSGRHHL